MKRMIRKERESVSNNIKERERLLDTVYAPPHFILYKNYLLLFTGIGV